MYKYIVSVKGVDCYITDEKYLIIMKIKPAAHYSVGYQFSYLEQSPIYDIREFSELDAMAYL